MKTGLLNGHLQGKVILLLLITLITVNIVRANQRVSTEPSRISLVEGDTTDLLCRAGTPIEYCRIVIPGEKVLVLSPKTSRSDFKYFGTGLENGQCGVTIERVSSRMHGTVKCFLADGGDELEGNIDLIVALPPNEPQIELISRSQDGAFEAGQPFRAKCVVRDGRPAANITWFLDDEPIYEGLGRQEFLDSPFKDTTVSTTTQEIQRYLTPEDNGKFLICRATHITDRGEPKEKRLQLLVSYRPQPQPDIRVYGVTLDRTAIINVTIQANPRPTVQWTVDGNVIPQGTQHDRYEAYEPLDLGMGAYNVSLSIAGLTLQDTIKDYSLKASNQFGSQDYTVRISSSNTPVSEGLDIGAIVGIVVAVIVLLAIVLLIVFARVTGRWCFAGATLNTDIGPDSEAQINPHHDDFDGKEYDGAEHIDTTHQSEEVTPPVTDKLESQKKADLKKNINGHQNGKDLKTNTPV